MYFEITVETRTITISAILIGLICSLFLTAITDIYEKHSIESASLVIRKKYLIYVKKYIQST